MLNGRQNLIVKLLKIEIPPTRSVVVASSMDLFFFFSWSTWLRMEITVYCLTKYWTGVVKRQKFSVNENVYLWYFRYDGFLWFAVHR